MPPARTAKKLADLLDLVVARAPELAAAGVTSLSVEGLSLTLAPAAPPKAAKAETPDRTLDGEAPPPPPVDPLNDPASYPGGRVPGFTRPRRQE